MCIRLFLCAVRLFRLFLSALACFVGKPLLANALGSTQFALCSLPRCFTGQRFTTGSLQHVVYDKRFSLTCLQYVHATCLCFSSDKCTLLCKFCTWAALGLPPLVCGLGIVRGQALFPASDGINFQCPLGENVF